MLCKYTNFLKYNEYKDYFFYIFFSTNSCLIAYFSPMDLENKMIKNDLQLYFNQVKGEVVEIDEAEKYSNITVKVGHNNTRLVNIVAKTESFRLLTDKVKIGDNVIAKFYITSNKKNERYYTTATLLQIDVINRS